jgi:hypothetical protein
MPRKKKEEAPKEGRPEGYDILIGYIKKFTYSDQSITEQMNNHPTPGRCYRLIKDTHGYRIHIGGENNQKGYDGLILGDKLKDSKNLFSYHIVVVTPSNYLDLGLSEDDTYKVVEWLTTDNADLWKTLKEEADHKETVVTTIGNALEVEFKDKVQIDPIEVETKIAEAILLSHSLNTISEKEPEAFDALLDVIEYISSTYSDKYNSPGMPNATKSILVASAVGAPANMCAAMKYAQRYMTTGFPKSYKVQDLYKIIHYALFEIQRRKHQGN